MKGGLYPEALAPSTRALWEILSKDSSLGGVYLVGGTALALRIRHRTSEDLDFAFLSKTLNGARIDRSLALLMNRGLEVRKIPDMASEQDFFDAGLDLSDYQRNYLIGNVKTTFFSADSEMASILEEERTEPGQVPVVPGLPALFALKAVACAHRSKSRDWFDIYVLLRDHGFRLEDMREVFRKHDPYNWDVAMVRLTSMKLSPADEGYAQLLADPPSLDMMRDFFRRERSRLEREEAASRILGKKSSFPDR
jgi:predicted nucleotidyltransferase component of viral defense system